jgi:[ribosomal protein S18]-alanine N-acetyltransferase
MTQQFRELNLADLDQIVAIEQQLFGPTAWNRDLFIDELNRIPVSRWYQVLEVNNQIIGYVGLAFSGTTADIQTIAVVPNQQRAGIGSSLLSLALAAAKQRGVEQVFLEVAVENEPAISLYKNYGFEQISIRPNYYGAGRNAYVMQREIGS